MTEMPRNSSTPADMKRKREPSPSLGDDKAAIGVTATTVDASKPPSQNKRPRRAAALRAESKMRVKGEEEEEEEDTIPPKSPPAAVKPEPGPRLESDAKVETKPEPNSSESRTSKAPARPGRRMATKQTPAAGPSATAPSRGDQPAEGQCGAPTPSQSPSKAARKAKGPSRAVKKARRERWKKWCEARKWISQHDPSYQQKVGDIVAHRSDAMPYYRFETYEIDTIPYVAFDNQYNQNSFGRSYNNSNLRTLISRKLAYLAGVDEQEGFDPETNEVEFLKEGWKLFEAATKEREENYMKKTNKPRKALKLWKIVPPRTYNSSTSHHHGTTKDRPFGSWTTRVYEDGKYIGDWLNFQFDPYADDFADFYTGYERFWPRGADWAWELGGLCSCCDL